MYTKYLKKYVLLSTGSIIIANKCMQESEISPTETEVSFHKTRYIRIRNLLLSKTHFRKFVSESAIRKPEFSTPEFLVLSYSFLANFSAWSYSIYVCICSTSGALGEISSDLYRDQIMRKFSNFSSWMFIHMFFFHFRIVFDEKIHFQAQQLFFFILCSFLHVWCPDMIIDIFSELDRNGLFNE